MTDRPTRETPDGRAYLALQKLARRNRRPTQELLQLYALESFVDRLTTCSASGNLVLKGGVLMSAFDIRRPTRDVDLSAKNMDGTPDAAEALIDEILSQPRDDGLVFAETSAERIRDTDEYQGVRISVPCMLSRAKVSFHVDINYGDPIWPGPISTQIPRLLGGTIEARGYPLTMVLAEKIVTAVQRGTANTRWRDFADILLVAAQHQVDADALCFAMDNVAAFRQASMRPLAEVLEGFDAIAQSRWAVWCSRQGIPGLPKEFVQVLSSVVAFADPAIAGACAQQAWSPTAREWQRRPQR